MAIFFFDNSKNKNNLVCHCSRVSLPIYVHFLGGLIMRMGLGIG